ncbi:MAG: hypothetical protein R3Y12_04010 [Clostridia bacterium]
MKKIFSLIIVLTMCLSINACSQDESNSIYIKPSDFSEETTKALEIFNDELQFYDIEVDETVKSYLLTIWVYKDGKWQETGKNLGAIEFLANQIAINLTKNDVKIFSIYENGNSTYYSEFETDFENMKGIMSTRIDVEIPIELNKEILIWVITGTKDTSMRAIDITKDFRSIECDAGVAITLILSDEIAE